MSSAPPFDPGIRELVDGLRVEAYNRASIAEAAIHTGIADPKFLRECGLSEPLIEAAMPIIKAQQAERAQEAMRQQALAAVGSLTDVAPCHEPETLRHSTPAMKVEAVRTI